MSTKPRSSRENRKEYLEACLTVFGKIAAMKKRDSLVIVICFAFLLPFFVIQIKFFSNSRLNVNITDHSAKSHQGTTISKRDPQHDQHLYSSHQNRRIVCDRSHGSYDICKINGPTVLDPTTSTFFLTGPTGPKVVEKIRPYPRKQENFVMSRIEEVNLVSGPIGPTCQVQHKAPALVFTAGGYTGNFFHDFNDGLIPLYITINTYFNDHQDDVVLVISKSRDWWVHKYSTLLQSFSKHPIINLDNDTVSHCFPFARLGLISHGFMTINPKLIPNHKTLIQFRAFLDKSYHQKSIPHKSNGSKPKPSQTRPRLVLVSRTGDVGRVLLNQEEIKEEAEKLGFDVVVFEPSSRISLGSAYDLINSSHTMIGIHGAALTHSLFLRPGSVFIQVVPLGLGWLAEVCFGKAAREMGLEYAEYRIIAEESSLVEKYGRDEMVIRDPVGFRGKSWSKNVMDVYLKEQNVRLDLDRFRGYLKQAYRKSRKFMEREE